MPAGTTKSRATSAYSGGGAAPVAAARPAARTQTQHPMYQPIAAAHPIAQPITGGMSAGGLGGFDLSSLYQTAATPAPAAAPAPAAPMTMTNTAPRGDDNMSWILNKVKSRAEGPGVSDRAIDRAGSKIRDFATGESNRLKGRMARTGNLGGGIHEQGEQAISDRAQSSMASAAADIELGRERDIDQLLSSTQGSFRAPAELSLAERGQNVSQWTAQNQLELERANAARSANMQQQQMILSMIQSLY